MHLHNCHFTSISFSKIQKYYFLSLGGVNNKITFLALLVNITLKGDICWFFIFLNCWMLRLGRMCYKSCYLKDKILCHSKFYSLLSLWDCFPTTFSKKKKDVFIFDYKFEEQPHFLIFHATSSNMLTYPCTVNESGWQPVLSICECKCLP